MIIFTFFNSLIFSNTEDGPARYLPPSLVREAYPKGCKRPTRVILWRVMCKNTQMSKECQLVALTLQNMHALLLKLYQSFKGSYPLRSHPFKEGGFVSEDGKMGRPMVNLGDQIPSLLQCVPDGSSRSHLPKGYEHSC